MGKMIRDLISYQVALNTIYDSMITGKEEKKEKEKKEEEEENKK